MKSARGAELVAGAWGLWSGIGRRFVPVVCLFVVALILGIFSYPEHLLPPLNGGRGKFSHRCQSGSVKATKRRACLPVLDCSLAGRLAV